MLLADPRGEGADESAGVRDDAHVPLRHDLEGVRVDRGANVDPKRQLLLELPGQCDLRQLARLDPSTGQLPFVARILDQHDSAFNEEYALDRCRDHLQSLTLIRLEGDSRLVKLGNEQTLPRTVR
jgi:hypothetical protein